MHVSLRLPDELVERIDAVAESEDRTRSYMITRALDLAFTPGVRDPLTPRGRDPGVYETSVPPHRPFTGPFTKEQQVGKRGKGG